MIVWLTWPVLLLLLPTEPVEMAKVILFYLLVCLVVTRCAEVRRCSWKEEWKASIGVTALLGGLFYMRWRSTEWVEFLAKEIHLPAELVTLAVAAPLVALVLWGGGIGTLIDLFKRFINWCFHGVERPAIKEKEEAVPLRQKGFLLLSTILIITLASKCSPLYPFNDWGDANIYFSIGKSMWDGFVPYRDLFDHKGPLVYMAHALAALVSYDSFFGVYLLEIVCCFAFLLYFYKTMRLYRDEKVLVLVPVVAALLYSARSFLYGDSVEELCLPLLMYALYVSVRSLRKEELPTWKDCFWIGVTSGCVLWVKFTMLGIYIGWIIVPFILAIRKKDLPGFFKRIGMIAAGVAVSTIPYLIYFGWNHAILDWLEVYLYDNLFVYSVPSGGVSAITTLGFNLLRGFKTLSQDNLPALVFIALGLCWCRKFENGTVFGSFLCQILGMFVFTYMGGRRYSYYALSLSIFSLYGVLAIYDLVRVNWKRCMALAKGGGNIKAGISLCLTALILFCFGQNIYMLPYTKADMPQYKIAEKIKASGIENPKVLTYQELDCGVYVPLGITPGFKYFFAPNIPLPEIQEYQEKVVDEGLADFVVSRSPYVLYNYKLIANYSIYNGEYKSYVTYYLYQLKE